MPIYHFTMMLCDGKMAEIVETDGSGRIVIPKSLRKELGIGRRTKFIITKRREGQILLQKIDIEEMARKLDEELRDTDIDAIVKEIRKEIDEKARERYPSLSA
jgi:bifunctional DNA-binding transcriptional regulator/antitoxin component of YhaV-PrlF toxin-antitoxin module